MIVQCRGVRLVYTGSERIRLRCRLRKVTIPQVYPPVVPNIAHHELTATSPQRPAFGRHAVRFLAPRTRNQIFDAVLGLANRAPSTWFRPQFALCQGSSVLGVLQHCVGQSALVQWLVGHLYSIVVACFGTSCWRRKDIQCEGTKGRLHRALESKFGMGKTEMSDRVGFDVWRGLQLERLAQMKAIFTPSPINPLLFLIIL